MCLMLQSRYRALPMLQKVPSPSVQFPLSKKHQNSANLGHHGLISLSALQLYVNGTMHVCFIQFLSFCIMVFRFTHDVVYSCSLFCFIMSHVANYFLPYALLECFYPALHPLYIQPFNKYLLSTSLDTMVEWRTRVITKITL